MLTNLLEFLGRKMLEFFSECPKQVKLWFYKLPVAGVGIEAVKLRNRIAEKRAKFSNNENSRKVCEKTCKISKKWQKVQIYLDEVKSVCKIRQRRLNKSKVTKKLSVWKTISIT